MNKEIIEKLKDNEAHRIFIDLSKEEQQLLWGIVNKNIAIQVFTENLKWIDKYGLLNNTDIYRIKPNYQPEPEYVDLEIKQNGNFLGVYSVESFLPFVFTHLHCLPSLPNFDELWYETNTGTRFGSAPIENVARNMAEGKKVYARFEVDSSHSYDKEQP